MRPRRRERRAADDAFLEASLRASLRRVLLLTISAAACRTAAPSFAALPESELGRYGFLADIYTDTKLTGMLTVSRDTVVLRADRASCAPAEEQNNPGFLIYSCTLAGTSGLSVRVNRRSPVRGSSWTTAIPVRTTRNVCLFYETPPNSPYKNCVRWTQEETYEYRRRSGDLKVTSW
jgi:hypothetical protein